MSKTEAQPTQVFCKYTVFSRYETQRIGCIKVAFPELEGLEAGRKVIKTECESCSVSKGCFKSHSLGHTVTLFFSVALWIFWKGYSPKIQT
jgi:hypothetical protein